MFCGHEEGRDDPVLSALNPQQLHSKSSTAKDEGRSSNNSMTATIIEIHSNNTSPVPEGHQSTKKADFVHLNTQLAAETHI